MEDDERYLLIDGGRWRRSDPDIPEGLRKQLVGALMEARRAVGAAKSSDDDAALAASRRRVQDAKVAPRRLRRPANLMHGGTVLA